MTAFSLLVVISVCYAMKEQGIFQSMSVQTHPSTARKILNKIYHANMTVLSRIKLISSRNFHRNPYQATANHSNFLSSLFVLHNFCRHVGHLYQLTEQRIGSLGTSNMAAVSATEEASSKKIVIVGGGLVI